MSDGMVAGARRLRWPLILAGIAAILLGAAAFEFGVLSGQGNPAGGPMHLSRDAEMERLKAENHSLTEQVARLETNEKINREAYQRIDSQLGGLQDKIIEQQEDLSFYRGVVGGAQASDVHVQKFVLAPGKTPSRFHLQLTLSQSRRAEKPVSGLLGLRLDGAQGSRATTFEVTDPDDARRSAGLKFAFRYFQTLDTDLSLPEGFTPSRVVVRLIPSDRSVEAHEESFPWAPRGS
jgi:hypothetical protein